jgi:hypothetical protein
MPHWLSGSRPTSEASLLNKLSPVSVGIIAEPSYNLLTNVTKWKLCAIICVTDTKQKADAYNIGAVSASADNAAGKTFT